LSLVLCSLWLLGARLRHTLLLLPLEHTQTAAHMLLFAPVASLMLPPLAAQAAEESEERKGPKGERPR